MKRSGDQNIEIAFFNTHYPGIEKLSYSMGISYMASYLKSKGIGSVTSTGGSRDLYNFLEELKKRDIKVFGIPVYDILFSSVRLIAAEARRYLPGVLIVAGGPTATFGDEIVLNNIPEIDIAVRGEGEETIYELYQYSAGRLSLDDVKGISFREGKRIVHNPARPLIGIGSRSGAELDVLPSPFETGILTGLERKAGLMTSRGCVFPCVFCSGPAMFGGKLRYHSIERVISDLKIISENIGNKREPPILDIWDDNFCLNRARTKRLCEAIIKEKLNFHFHTPVRADRVDRDLLSLMYEAGMRWLNFGLESAVPGVLRKIKKVNGKSEDLREEKEYIEAVRRAVKHCKEIGITPTVNAMFGLPGETFEDGLATIKMIEDLNVATYYHNQFTAFTGTEVYREPEKFDIKIRRSKRILPVHQSYPYNVSDIPLLPNVLSLEHSLSNIHLFENSVFQLPDMAHGYLTDTNINFVLVDFHSIDNKMLEWMKQLSGFYSHVFLKYNESSPDAEELKQIKKSIRRDLLGREPTVIEKSSAKMPEGADLYFTKTGLYRKHRLYSPARYYSYPFHKAGITKQKTKKDRVVLLKISDRRDVEYFIDTMREQPDDLQRSVIGRMIENEMLLASSCRFSGRPCPARLLQKLVVLGNGEVKACENGCCIGHTGDSFNALYESIEKISSEIDDERGCRNCPVKENCSRCIFPEPFARQEFCDFIKSARWFPKTLRFLMICHEARMKKIFFDQIEGIRDKTMSGRELVV
ncbi:MAG: B12-binding domain-containing radical SAM protein [Chloroflexi bacterium]|nr:B12-binding domain-containing radical SAM protein [Chloroflexota bacterium]